MHVRSRSARILLPLAAALLAFQFHPAAQAAAAKRPLGYDAVDDWRSIQGIRLSDDGQWLAYATTMQGDDGEVIVRNLRTGQEFRQPRGTSPQFTPDAKFVVFTIAQPKADELKDAASETQTPEEPAAEQPSGRGNQSRVPKTGMGIMSLPDGQVKTFEKVGSFALPENSS